MPDGLSAEWLTTALKDCDLLTEQGVVTEVTATQVGDGVGMMSELARLNLTYAGDDQAPATMVAKFPSRNETNRDVAMQYRIYEREVKFFQERAEHTAMCTPRMHIAEMQGDNFLLLMEDLSAYQEGDQVVGADLSQTEIALDELAKLHASHWDSVEDLVWVPGVADSYHADNMANLSAVGWPVMCEVFADVLPPEVAAAGEVFQGAVRKLQAAMCEAPKTLLHGDFRMENFFFGQLPGQHPMIVIDWQGPLLGNCMVDVAQMLCQSTQKDVRREHETELLERYTRSLVERGVDYDLERARRDFKTAIFYHWAYTSVVAGTLDTSNPASYAWMAKMIERQSAASLDHNVFTESEYV